MNPDQTRRAFELFSQLCVLPAAERDTVLRAECGDDEVLRQHVARMLSADDEDESEDSLTGTLSISTANRSWLDRIWIDAQSDDKDPLVPDRIGDYEVVRLIGEGGMGLVYEAKQRSPNRRVALKLLRPGSATDERVRRFDQESEILGRLVHPGIAQVYESGSLETKRGSQPYFAMEYVAGQPITRHCDRLHLPIRRRLELLAQVCDASHYAHEQGVVHRDLKPDNILVDDHGHTKILDFGVARDEAAGGTLLTRTGDLIGTLAYMAPEQVSGDPNRVSRSADVYALGVIAFELLCHESPIDVAGLQLTEAIDKVRDHEPRRLGSVLTSLRGDVETIVGKALEREPQRRYPTAKAFAADIRRWLNDETILARPQTTFYQLRKFARRNRALVAGVLTALVVLTAGLIFALIARDRAARDAERMEQLAIQNAMIAASYTIDRQPIESRRQLDSIPEELRGWSWRHLDQRLRGWAFELESPSPLVTPARYVHGGQSIAAAGEDGRLFAWDAKSGERIGEIETHLEITAIASDAPEGPILVGTATGEILRWSQAEGTLTSESVGNGPVVAIRHEGTDSLLIAHGNRVVRMNDDDGRTRRIGKITVGSRARPGLEALPNGSVWASNGRTLKIETNGSKRDVRLPEPPASLSADPSGSQIAAGSRMGVIFLADVVTDGDPIPIPGHAGRVMGTAFIPGSRGRELISAGADGTLRRWDLRTGDQLSCQLIGFEPLDLDVDPEARHVIVSGDGRARVWPTRDGDQTLEDHAGYVFGLQFDSTSTMLASATFVQIKDKQPRIWNASDGRLLARLPIDLRGRLHGFSTDSRSLVASRAGGRPQNIDVITGAESALEFDLPEDPTAADRLATFAPFIESRVGALRGTHFQGTWAPDGVHRAKRLRDESTVQILNGETVIASLSDVRMEANPDFSPDGRLLAVPTPDGEVIVWPWQNPEQSRIRLQGHSGRVHAAAFSPDGRLLATAGADARIVIWNTATWRSVVALIGHSSAVRVLAWSPDGSTLASGGYDRTIRLWHTTSRAERHRESVADSELATRARSLAANQGADAAGETLREKNELSPSALRMLIEHAARNR